MVFSGTKQAPLISPFLVTFGKNYGCEWLSMVIFRATAIFAAYCSYVSYHIKYIIWNLYKFICSYILKRQRWRRSQIWKKPKEISKKLENKNKNVQQINFKSQVSKELSFLSFYPDALFDSFLLYNRIICQIAIQIKAGYRSARIKQKEYRWWDSNPQSLA